eukprot:4829465-Pyramimonas_sp.AAC.1
MFLLFDVALLQLLLRRGWDRPRLASVPGGNDIRIQIRRGVDHKLLRGLTAAASFAAHQQRAPRNLGSSEERGEEEEEVEE